MERLVSIFVCDFAFLLVSVDMMAEARLANGITRWAYRLSGEINDKVEGPLIPKSLSVPECSSLNFIHVKGKNLSYFGGFSIIHNEPNNNSVNKWNL